MVHFYSSQSNQEKIKIHLLFFLPLAISYFNFPPYQTHSKSMKKKDDKKFQNKFHKLPIKKYIEMVITSWILLVDALRAFVKEH